MRRSEDRRNPGTTRDKAVTGGRVVGGGECFLFVSVPTWPARFLTQMLTGGLCETAGAYGNGEVRSGAPVIWKTKAERNISEKETLSKMRSVLWI